MQGTYDVAAQGDTFTLDRVTWELDDEDMEFLRAAIDSAPLVVYDLETTGLEAYAVTGGKVNAGIAARISLASLTIPTYDEFGSIAGEPTTWVLPLSHPHSPWVGEWRTVWRGIAEMFVENSTRLVNHNIKYDNTYTFATTGVDLSYLTHWDTHISSHLLDETESTRLKNRAAAVFGIDPWDDFDLSSPGVSERVPILQLGE